MKWNKSQDVPHYGSPNHNFFGHVVRENGLEKLVLEGKIDGLRSRGRQRKKYLDDLVAAVGCLRKGELFHLTQDRERFKCIVANVN